MQLVVNVMMRPYGLFNEQPWTPLVKNIVSAARTESGANKKETPSLIFMPLSWHINKSELNSAELNSYTVDLIPQNVCRPPAVYENSQTESALLGVALPQEKFFPQRDVVCSAATPVGLIIT